MFNISFCGRVLLLWVLIVFSAGCKTYHPMPEAEHALLGSDTVSVTTDNQWIHFQPTATSSNAGVIFYPGANVKPEAYAPLMLSIAEQGYSAFIVRFPLNLAILAPNRAAAIRNQFSNSIQQWFIAGHSLGGTMAARYVAQQAQSNETGSGVLQGLWLLAAYPSASDDLSQSDVNVLSLYATEDNLTTLQDIENSAAYLPAATQWVEIEGGNHAQFGWYGEQTGDGAPLISREAQQQIVLDALLNSLWSMP